MGRGGEWGGVGSGEGWGGVGREGRRRRGAAHPYERGLQLVPFRVQGKLRLLKLLHPRERLLVPPLLRLSLLALGRRRRLGRFRVVLALQLRLVIATGVGWR